MPLDPPRWHTWARKPHSNQYVTYLFNNLRTGLQEQAIAPEQRGPSWEVKEDELEVTDQRLGIGGWAEVSVAKLKVAAKVLLEQLIYNCH